MLNSIDMKKIIVFLMMFATVSANAHPGKKHRDTDSTHVQSELILPACLLQYADSLQQLIRDYRNADSLRNAGYHNTVISPYFYQMVSPGTLYNKPLSQALGVNWSSASASEGHIVSKEVISDAELSRLYFSNEALNGMYVAYPNLISTTEKEIMESGSVMKDIDTPIKTGLGLSEEMKFAELDREDVGEVVAELRRPNFWKFSGSNSLNLTQNYATDNWFQGKANYYNALAILAIDVGFNNQRMIQWDNRLDVQLGFQTLQDNEYQKFRPTNNLLRLTSKLGVKAIKNWNYAVSVKTETQLVPYMEYNNQGDAKCKTDILSPLTMDVAVGIDWKWNLKRFTGSLMLAPGTYNMKYVDRLDLSTRYGVEKDEHVKHTFGPSATARFNWKIANNIGWDSRLYWITNLEYTNIEFENTITFSVNKYLTSKVYFYPRFNDQSIKNKMQDDDGNYTGTYWMFKEWFSLGVSYNW